MEVILGVFLLFSFFLSTVKGQSQIPRTGSVRLNNGGNANIENRDGDVEVYYKGDWKYICKDFDANDDTYGHVPDVVCHQLGYTGGGVQPYYGSGHNSEIGFYDMSCKKNYLVILQCSFKTDNVPANCESGRNVWVTCYYTRIWDRAPYTGMVRLVNSSYIGQGIVEVYCHGNWGIVCNKTKSESFALTVCKQLGYNLVSSYDYNTTFSKAFFVSMQDAKCGKKCITDCASCDENDIDSCGHGILNVACEYDKGSASKHGNKMGACAPINLYPGQLAVTALVLILFIYVYFITRVCIRIITICRKRRRGQPLLERNVNDEDNNNNKCRARCSVICDILCCN